MTTQSNNPDSIESTAFVDVSVLPMDHDGVLAHQTVVVTGGRVTEIRPAGDVGLPLDSRLIDGKGLFLMPGLADMHTHLGIRDKDPRHLVLYLAQGVTTVRSMSGAAENREWRRQVEDGELLGPTIFSSDETVIGGLEGESPEKLASLPIFMPKTPEEAAAEVRRQAAGWADFVKVYDGLTPEQYFAAIKAANQANFYVVGHALDEASLEDILTSGINEIAHIDELNFYHWIGFPDQPDFALDYDAIPLTASLMKENNVSIVSNLVADETMIDLMFDTEAVLSRPEYKVVRPQTLHSWRTEGRQLSKYAEQGLYRRDLEMPFLRALLLSLTKAGVPITIGTDTSTLEGSVQSLIHRDLELLVESGFSNFEALAAGTATAGAVARRMGRDGSFGTVAAGQRADLLLLAANPLEDVGNTRRRVGVMARGNWHPQADLDQMVEKFVSTYDPISV